MNQIVVSRSRPLAGTASLNVGADSNPPYEIGRLRIATLRSSFRVGALSLSAPVQEQK
ncbi:MAG: hypothetical protein FJ042_01655 [Candidatus Cloacimonetes bacterium]|nr:hypothetical protein [Candidatus Cloacimonadota bacterium]